MSASDDAAVQIDSNQLRSSLRLCFASEQADSLAALCRRSEIDPVRSLAPVIRAAQTLYSVRRIVAPLTGRRANEPLRPRLGLSAEPALALALHLGLGFDARLLGRLFNQSPAEIGASLQQARRFAESERTEPCPEFAPLIGRHRDLWMDRSDQITLLQHVSICEECRHTLDVARETDARLLATIEANAGRLAPLRTRKRYSLILLANPAIPWLGASLTLFVLLAGLLLGVNRFLPSSHHAAPLTAATFTQLPAGWLLEASGTGAVDAVDLPTGERRLLVPGVSDTKVDDLISPDRRTIAQVIYLQYPAQPESLYIYGLDGTLRERWDLETVRYVRTPIGWIDNSRLLLSQLPVSAYEPTLNVYTNNQRQVSSLVVLNVVTGAEQPVADQGVHLAAPSPDGKFIAIDYYNTQTADTLEIRPFDGRQLGPAVATFDVQPTGIWWSPDSSHLYATIRKPTDGVASPASGGGGADDGGPFTIAQIDRSGQAQPLVALGAHDFVSLLGLSPDGGTLVYSRGTGTSGTSPWAFWEVNTSNGQTTRLGDGDPKQPGAAQVAWAPDGSGFVLTNAEPFYLAPSSSNSLLSYMTIAFDPQGQPLGAALDELTAHTLLAWLPSASVPAAKPIQSTTTGSSGATGSTSGAAPNLTINAFSQSSPDGSSMLLFDPALDAYADQPLDGSVAQSMSGAALEPSWFPDGTGTIGVRQANLTEQVGGELILGGAPNVAVASIFQFDPADIGALTNAEYHEPLFSPDGLHYSFFLVSSGTVQLWVGGRNQAARSVATWVIPNDAMVDLPLAAKWVDKNDLIFLMADNWSRGLPQRAVLERWSLAPGGVGSVRTLIGWSTRGSEAGILGQELSLSADGSRLAIRLRHFTGADPQTDRYDSIVVAATNDVSQAFEIVRDSPGSGLSWSPDGSELAAGLRGKIAVLAADGRTVEYPQIGNESAAYPLWIQPNQIWFSADNGTRQVIESLTR